MDSWRLWTVVDGGGTVDGRGPGQPHGCRNRHDGSVEALVIGIQAAIDDFIDWAQVGPPKAQVLRIEISVADEEPTDGFEQRPSA